MIEWFANEKVSRSMCTIFLLNKAKNLPSCRKNILITKILRWSAYIDKLCSDLLHGAHNVELKDINKECRDFLFNNKLANNNFIDFFFTFHAPIASRFESQISKTLYSELTTKQKIVSLTYLYKELINLTRIELENFEIDCSVIGNNHICKTHECANQPNIITLMITPEYVEREYIINDIIKVLKEYIVKPNKVSLVVDYRNLCSYYSGVYKWEKSGAYERYELIKKFLKNIYFYKYECVDFGKYYKKVKPHLISNKKELLTKVYGRKNELVKSNSCFGKCN